MGDERGRTREIRHEMGEFVDQAILKPQLRNPRIAKPRFDIGRICAARVRRGYQHRNPGFAHTADAEGWRPAAGDQSP